MSLDVNTLIANSLSKYSEESTTDETVTTDDLALDLEGKTEEEVVADTAINNDLALDLEAVAEDTKFTELVSEDIMNNIKGAVGAGIATVAVLEARAAKRDAESTAAAAAAVVAVEKTKTEEEATA
ncbi:MAG: hypothetical protein DRG78_03440 [Epsilonproteobacteria bacterium]|nr:MAG: hypothetical protein DRG78_03440 [Campylobacterota bacterium]